MIEPQTQTAARAAKGASGAQAAPPVSLRPAINGLQVVARSIARAPQRSLVQSKL